jgi:hypothetical protein
LLIRILLWRSVLLLRVGLGWGWGVLLLRVLARIRIAIGAILLRSIRLLRRDLRRRKGKRNYGGGRADEPSRQA